MDFHNCVNCDAALIVASTICPQCGWSKDKPIGPVEEAEIKVSSPTDEPTEIKNRLPRPAGVRLISIFYMLFGISLILFGIIFVSAVMFLVMLSGMGTLGDIGGTGGMMILPGMNGIDASTKSSLDNIIDLNTIAGSLSASEIE